MHRLIGSCHLSMFEEGLDLSYASAFKLQPADVSVQTGTKPTPFLVGTNPRYTLAKVKMDRIQSMNG